MMIDMISEYKDNSFLYNHALITDPMYADFGLHTHDICEIIYIKKGDVSGIINGKTYNLGQNNLIIFRPQVIHGIKIETNEPYERINVLFDEKLVANGVFETIPKYFDVINFSGNKQIADLFNKFDFYYKNFEGENLKKLTSNLIDEVIFNLSLVSKEGVSENYVALNSVVDRAIEYIDSNYENPILIEQICNELFISKSHLHHLFKERFNMTPKKYINIQRLSKARRMIREGNKPYEVYLVCGFKDYSSFYRSYKILFGHSPSEEMDTQIDISIIPKYNLT